MPSQASHFKPVPTQFSYIQILNLVCRSSQVFVLCEKDDVRPLFVYSTSFSQVDTLSQAQT